MGRQPSTFIIGEPVKRGDEWYVFARHPSGQQEHVRTHIRQNCTSSTFGPRRATWSPEIVQPKRHIRSLRGKRATSVQGNKLHPMVFFRRQLRDTPLERAHLPLGPPKILVVEHAELLILSF